MNDIFWEIHQDNPREGPGDNASTRRAYLSLPLPAAPLKIADMGCGPGMQTLELARLSHGTVWALDLHQPFLDELSRRAAEEKLDHYIKPVHASMGNSGFEAGTFDLIWSEGAIYIIGFETGLRMWRPLLKAGGCIAVTELSWITHDPPEEARKFWAENYPGMHSVEENLEVVRSAGYVILGHFTLPKSAWLDGYYRPLEDKIALLRKKYAGNQDTQQALDAEQYEIDLYRQYSDAYGYEFYLLRSIP